MYVRVQIAWGTCAVMIENSIEKIVRFLIKIFSFFFSE